MQLKNQKQAKKPEKDPEGKLIKEYLDQLQRLQAEFENFQKRTDKEKEAIIKHANKHLIQKFLPIKDDFERALASKKTDDTFSEGVSMIFSAFNKLLEEEGVEEIKAKGATCDPFKHEVMVQEESDLPDNQVIDELQKGYTLKGEVIRPAKVKVSKKKKNQKEGKEE